MKAIVVYEFGPPEVMKLEEVPSPSPGPGEILVRVKAIGVNPVDSKMRRAGAPGTAVPNPPRILGWDAAGTVEAIGAVPPGGHFFGSPHTLERYETIFYQPIVSDWRNYETWADDGMKDAAVRANRIWKQMLEEYEAPPIDPGILDGLNDYAARRREEIAARGLDE